MISKIGNDYNSIQLPTKDRNYAKFNEIKVMYYISQKERALPKIDEVLKSSNDEKEVTESLYILNRMLDDGVTGIDKMYPTLSRFNDTESPNIQTFLAGIYRKTKVPDGFGPLINMLIKNSLKSEKYDFDPNEEIGGAILDYIV